MKKILITGSSGFIGTNLVAKILKMEQIIVLGIDKVSPKIKEHEICFKKVDLLDKKRLHNVVLNFNPDYVIHLAARTDLDGVTLEDYESNTKAVDNLLDVLANLKHLKRVLFASSMYVCYPGYKPQGDLDFKPHTLYGESKVITEQKVRARKLNYESVIVRPTSIWGPWFGIPYRTFFDIVMSKKYFHMGAKVCNKTYGYIDNTVYQLLQLLEADYTLVKDKVVYLGDNPPYNISEWADEIAEELDFKIKNIPYFCFKILAYIGDFLKIFNLSFPMTSFRLKNMTTDNIHDLSLIYKVAPDIPVSRKEGVKRTLKWIYSK